MSRKKNSPAESRKLVDLLAGALEFGAIRGALATTYDFNPEFFEVDFLPSLFGLGAWDDRRWVSRIALEKCLASSEAIAVMMDARRYQGRPRSLRVQVVPQVGARGQMLHAKVTLLVYEEAVRLLVSSANLTEPGFRSNREVALCLTATKKKPQDGLLIAQALEQAPSLLEAWWSDAAGKLTREALSLLASWQVDQESSEEAFLWSGGPEPLWRQFLSRWPADEQVQRIHIVSPFWSTDARDGGPLGMLLSALQERGALGPGAQVTLVTSAARDASSKLRPELPPAVAGFDASPWGASACAVAADPKVQPDEVQGNEHVLRERSLHAKVVLLAGPKSTLAYAGSANFSAHGWGFMPDPTLASVEAGFALLRTGRHRAALDSLIPPTSGDRVPLGASGQGSFIAPAPPEADKPWPLFINGIWLRPVADDPAVLELHVEVVASRVEGPFSIALSDGEAGVLVDCQQPPGGPIRVPLDGDAVGALLRRQCVLVSWWASPEPIEFPINATMEARDHLPLSPGEGRPSENMLLQYYQGRIAWEDLFPETERHSAGQPQAADEYSISSVETSRIQSYQVREFVEALKGIHDDLRRAAISERAIRLAVLGPVSPVALARQIGDASRKGERSATAAAFQLLELTSLLAGARGWEVEERLHSSWVEAIDKASEEVQRVFDGVRREAGDVLGHSDFRAYESMVRKQFGPEGEAS